MAYAIRSTYHTTLQHTPGQLVFGRDMMLPINCKVDWALVAQRKQELINKSNKRENNKRIPHAYSIGDKVMLHKPGMLPKMTTPNDGPFTISAVHSNGTITINKSAAVTQTVNIRRVTPYFD